MRLPAVCGLCVHACVCAPSSPSSSPPVPSPYSPARSSQPSWLPAARGISRRELSSTTPRRAAKPAMRGGSLGSASATAPRRVNPFYARRPALIRPLDLPREVGGKVGSSRSVRVRGYTRVHRGTTGMSQWQPGLRQCWGQVWCPLGDEPPAPAQPRALSTAFVWELRCRQREIERRALPGGGQASSTRHRHPKGTMLPIAPLPPSLRPEKFWHQRDARFAESIWG